MTLILKVLCGQCGKKIGEAHKDHAGIRYRPLWQTGSGLAKPQPGDSITSARFWCLGHGWTDPAAIDNAVSQAPTGKVMTHRARMYPR